MRWLLIVALTACGTASQNTKVAAIAGAAAAAATTALDPDYASRSEQEEQVLSMDGKPVSHTVPVDVFDHLDTIPLE